MELQEYLRTRKIDAVLNMYSMIGDLGVQPSTDLISVLFFDENLAMARLNTAIDELVQHKEEAKTIDAFFTECDRLNRPPVFARQATPILNGLDCHIEEVAGMRILMRSASEFADVCAVRLKAQPISRSEMIDLSSNSHITDVSGQRRVSISSINSELSNTSLNTATSAQSQDIDANTSFGASEIETSNSARATEPSNPANANEPSHATNSIEPTNPANTIESNHATNAIEPSKQTKLSEPIHTDEIEANDTSRMSEVKSSGTHDLNSLSDEDKVISFVPKSKRSRPTDDVEESDDDVRPPKRKQAPLAKHLEIQELCTGVDFGEPAPHA